MTNKPIGIDHLSGKTVLRQGGSHLWVLADNNNWTWGLAELPLAEQDYSTSDIA